MRNKLIFIVINCCLLQCFICDTNVYNSASDGTAAATETTNPEDHVDAETQSEVSEPLAVTAAAIESGNTELLSPSLRGLAAMATANLPDNLRLVKVIEATREVVAGFRYDLTVEVTQPGDGHAYPCRLAILERPWVTTEWGARERSLLSTNCSNDLNSENNELLASAPRPADQEAERPTEITKVEPNYDSIADSGQVEELLEQFTDKDRFTSTDTAKNLEQAQEQMVEQQVIKNVEQRQQQKHFLTKVEAMVGLKRWLDDVRIMEHTEKPYVYDATMDPVFVQSAPVNYHKLAEDQEDDLVQRQLKQEQQEVRTEQDVQQETQLPEKPDTTLNVIGLDYDQNLRNGAISNDETRTRRGLKAKGAPVPVDSNDPYVQELMQGAFTQLVSSEGSSSDIKLHKITDCTKQVVAGSLVKCTIHVKTSESEENKECAVTVWDRPWLTDAKETEIDCSKLNDAGEKIRTSLYKFPANKRVERSADEEEEAEYHIVGGPAPIESNATYIQELMQSVLAELATAEGAGDKVKLHKVTNCTTQVVAGTLVKCQIHLEGLTADEKHECEVSIWDRAWIPDSRQTDVDCTKIHENGVRGSVKKYKFGKALERRKRGVPGGVSPADSSDSYILELMQDAFAQLVTAEGAGSGAKLHKLSDCTKQVVAGSKVICTMHVHGLGNDEKHECRVEIWDRPWLGKENRETTLQCSKIHENGVKGSEKKYEFKPKVRVERSAERRKRQLVFGAPSTADPNGEYIQELMQDAFTKLVSAEGSGASGAKLHKLTDCTSQVVAGSKVICTMHVHGLGNDEKHECRVEIWDRPWLGKENRETTLQCSKLHENGVRGSEKKYEFKPKVRIERRKRQLGFGAPSTADPNGEYIQELMQDAFTKLVSAEGSGASRAKLHQLTDCTSQVVAGSKVICKMHVHGLGENEKHECQVEVWDRSWLPNGRQTEITCSKIHENGIRGTEKKYTFGKAQDRKKRGIRGGVSPADSSDSYIQELMQDAFAQLVTAEGAGSGAKLHQLSDCTKQVVAGSKVICTMHVHGLGNDEKHECKVEVWDRPWLGKENRETTLQCSQIHENGVKGSEKKYEFKPKAQVERRKRQLGFGAPSTADPNGEYIQELMQDAFTKLVSAEGSGASGAKLHKLTDCTSQVVAGVSMKCTMHVHGLGNDEKHECQVEVWDRAWLGKENRETTLLCSKIHENGVRGTEKKYEFKPKVRVERSLEEHSLTHEDLKTWRLFAKFTQKHDKRYDADEARYRFGVFKENLKRIERLNRGELGTAHYGITQFSDLTQEEFRSRHTGLLPRPAHADNEVPHASATIPGDIPLPESFDWRDHGAVAKVKDQGSCGSCWAFSVTGNIEGLNAIRTGKLQEFSEQELVDCDTIDSGCGGGLPDNAYKAIEQLGGLESETDYPYEGKKERCHFDKSATKVQVSGAVDLPQNETAMALWLIQNGPISIGINANAMQFYRGGVSHPWKILCNKSSLDHGVLIVGYGVHTYPKFNKSMPYWIIKNSWGPRWGEQGYYRVYRGDSTCGVDQMATSAVLENPN